MEQNKTASGDLASASRDSIGAKCGGIVIMFLLPFLIGLAPLKTSKLRNAARITSIASCFGGGVFFGTCFMHLIPEVAVEINKWKEESDSLLLTTLPLAEILECLGFTIIMFVETIVHNMSHGHGHHPLTPEELDVQTDRVAMKANGEGKTTASTDEEVQHMIPNGNKPQKSKTVGVLIFALAVHSFFEGLAIGVEARANVFLQLAGAILIHKCVVAFAVGTRLIDAGQTLKEMLISLFIFCICTPIGIGVAMGILDLLISTGDTTMNLVSGVIQGLSTGFFLYITFAEMIFEEMRNEKDLILKVMFMALGCILIGASTVWHNYADGVAIMAAENEHSAP